MEISAILHATSSGGTQAGLIAGKGPASFPGEIIGIAVAKSGAQLADEVHALAENTAAFLNTKIDAGDVSVEGRFIGDGYAVPSVQGREARRLFAQLEGIVLDDVYTAKSAAGLISLCRENRFSRNGAVVFLHTGGAP